MRYDGYERMTDMSASDDGILRQAVARHQAGQLQQAEPLYREVLARRPDHPDALHLLGVLNGQLGRLDQAIELIRRAIALDPAVARYHCNLGKFLGDKGLPDQAVGALRTAIGLAPDYAQAPSNLGAVLSAMGRFDEAASACRDALAIAPRLVAAHINLGNALRGQIRPDEAIAIYRAGLEIEPGNAELHHNLGNVLKDTGQIEEAIAAYRAALQVRPDFAEARHHLINTLHYNPAFDAAALGEEARRWHLVHAAPLERSRRPHDNDRTPDRRLRVGYVSPDFREHPVGLNLLPLFRSQHHRVVIEVLLLLGQRPGRRVTDASARSRTGGATSPDSPTSRWPTCVRDDRIDILVDLSLHAAGNRLSRLRARACARAGDLRRLSGNDRTRDDRLSSHRPVSRSAGRTRRVSTRRNRSGCPTRSGATTRLPTRCRWAPPPAASAGLVTFGCLNNFCKVNDKVLDLWAGVLRELDSSRLLMLSPPGSHRDRVTETLRRLGVAPERIAFVGSRPRLEYLQMYHRIDVGLDTLPYNGHTTSLDAYWMGVPVVSLVGSTVVGRAGLSQSMNLGLPDLVASTAGEFVRIAAGLARDVDRLATLRSTLRSRMQNSPLMDGPRFARNIEAAYREMWRRWCAG